MITQDNHILCVTSPSVNKLFISLNYTIEIELIAFLSIFTLSSGIGAPLAHAAFRHLYCLICLKSADIMIVSFEDKKY